MISAAVAKKNWREFGTLRWCYCREAALLVAMNEWAVLGSNQ
jgi:hypothetical protein